MRSTVLAVTLLVFGTPEARAADAQTCNVLTPADIKAVTGDDVQPLAKGASPGAGGCANFKGADGHAYLGVDRHRGAGAFQTAVSSVPQDAYPVRTPVAGLGDEAVLMKDETGRMRYLVARKGENTVVLFPLTFDKGGEVGSLDWAPSSTFDGLTVATERITADGFGVAGTEPAAVPADPGR
jgi:hypothetical protein